MSEISDLASVFEMPAEHVVVAGGTVAGAWALKKVVGPTLDAIGGALGDFSDYRLRNLLRIGDKIYARLSEDQPALESMHPRVAKVLLEEGTWLDDDVAQEYFAGMLIGAASPFDDQSDTPYFARLAATLGPQHLRMHHAMYEALRFGPSNVFANPLQPDNPYEVYVPAPSAPFMAGNNFVVRNRDMLGVVNVLRRESLIGIHASGGAAQLRRDWIPENPAGSLISPSDVGAELFLRAYGRRGGVLTLTGDIDLPKLQTDMPRYETFLFQDYKPNGQREPKWIDRRPTAHAESEQ